MLDKLAGIERRYEHVEAQLMDPEVVTRHDEVQRLGKERSELEPVVTAIRDYRKALGDLRQVEELLSDPEMKELAVEELEPAKAKVTDLESKIKLMLIPKDPNDEKSVIIEIRPAAGGEEASLFCSELYRMYTRYAERRKWKYEIIELDESPLKGLDRVVFSLGAKGAYSVLKFESGVHRVQRVPVTESSGRTHTSTVTVAVLPEAEDADVEIRQDDLEISTFNSSSAGGQHMQKNETAIRIIHKPTGLVVTCQDERSQLQNKVKAMSALRTRLYQLEQDRLAQERGQLRKGQIGSGDRSEKIRTYNFPQSRITDHRIGMDTFNVNEFMDGGIQEMLDALAQDAQARKLAEAEA